MKKVAVLTTFYEVTSGYSLVAVAETQIRMLLDHGYDPVVVLQEGAYQEDKDGNVIECDPFKEQPLPSVWNRQAVDLRPVLPALRLTGKVDDDFDERVARIYKSLEIALEGVEVCIAHDLILQNFYLEHNVALRKYAKTRPDLLWLHWIHSVPTPLAVIPERPYDARYTPPPGYIIYPNDSEKGRVTRTYNLHGREWKVIIDRSGHSIDPLLNYDKLTVDLAKSADLLSGEIIAVYPARLDKGKQPEKIIRLLAGVQKREIETRLLIIDWQSGASRFQKYIDELSDLAEELGVCVSFTSRLDDRCNQGVSRKVVLELLDLANVYIHPSRVETYSLVVHEAMLKGCLCVLNHDLSPMRELFGNNAIYMDFGSDAVERMYEPNEQSFWNDEAMRLLAEMKQNRTLVAQSNARRLWSPDAMWNSFEPLLYKTPVGE